MKALLRLLILAILVAGVMALMLGLGRYWSPLTVAHWKGQLEAVPDQSAGSLLGRVGSSGDMGIAILVEALASPRERIARAARQSLLQQIDQWKTLSAAGSSPKFALLAHELADRQAELGPAGRHNAAELAIPILQGPLDPGTEEAVEVIACCEKVLQAAQADPPSAVADALARRAERDVASAAAAALPDAGRWPAAAVQEPSLIPGLLPGVDSPKPPSADDRRPAEKDRPFGCGSGDQAHPVPGLRKARGRRGGPPGVGRREAARRAGRRTEGRRVAGAVTARVFAGRGDGRGGADGAFAARIHRGPL